MKQMSIKRALLPVLLVVGLLVAFGAGLLTGIGAQPVRAQDAPSEFGVFWEAWNYVVDDFVDREEVDFTEMTYGAIRGMLATLGDDNHTVFFTPDEAEQQASALEGEFEGIGAYVGMEDGQFRILAPIHGSPAEAAGLVAGDIVLMVDGEEIGGKEEWEIISMIRGPAGSDVTLLILHPDADEPEEITITRGRIQTESVVWTAVPGTEIAYLQIAQFAADTDVELIKALEEINAHEPAFQGILLDLRNNPGGYLHIAQSVISQFVPEGEVILYERDAEGTLTEYLSRGEGLAREIPLIALINPGTASAGEIMAGALQQNGRARLVGETTLGTGTVLRPYQLSDGSVLRLGVTNWLTPDQSLLKDEGVSPDVPITLQSAIAPLDSFALEEMTAEDLKSIEDPQFKSALFLLRLQVRNAATAQQPLQQ